MQTWSKKFGQLVNVCFHVGLYVGKTKEILAHRLCKAWYRVYIYRSLLVC